MASNIPKAAACVLLSMFNQLLGTVFEIFLQNVSFTKQVN